MNEKTAEYEAARASGAGFYERKRGLIEVSGAEAVMFLNGLITNDAAKLENGKWMLAAFPNAQGRLLAVVRVLRFADVFLFDTENATYKKVLQNLSRFTMAGDFKVRDLTGEFHVFAVRGTQNSTSDLSVPFENEIAETEINGENVFAVKAFRAVGIDVFVPKNQLGNFVKNLELAGAIPLGEDVREVLRVENGEPRFAVDMDETTIVPELGIAELISYNKGCYIGQEIIARIHFRGHVAKQLTGLVLENEAKSGDELKSPDGKNAGKITSVTFSPTFQKFIALAFVRYEFLAEGTKLKINETAATVKNLPFV